MAIMDKYNSYAQAYDEGGLGNPPQKEVNTLQALGQLFKGLGGVAYGIDPGARKTGQTQQYLGQMAQEQQNQAAMEARDREARLNMIKNMYDDDVNAERMAEDDKYRRASLAIQSRGLDNKPTSGDEILQKSLAGFQAQQQQKIKDKAAGEKGNKMVGAIKDIYYALGGDRPVDEFSPEAQALQLSSFGDTLAKDLTAKGFRLSNMPQTINKPRLGQTVDNSSAQAGGKAKVGDVVTAKDGKKYVATESGWKPVEG